MKFLTSRVVALVAIAQSLKVALCRVNELNGAFMAPSFIISDSAMQEAGEKAGVVFAEMATLQDSVVDAVANTMLSFLESQGFDYEDPQHMNNLISFLETMVTEEPVKSKTAKFLDGLKQMALKTWHATKGAAKDAAKRALLVSIKGILKESIKEALPLLEKVNEKAMRTLPVNLRVALAPIAYNMWRKFFEKTKVTLPPGFNIENFVCSTIDKEKCDEIIRKVKEEGAPKKSKQLALTNDETLDFEDDEEDKDIAI